MLQTRLVKRVVNGSFIPKYPVYTTEQAHCTECKSLEASAYKLYTSKIIQVNIQACTSQCTSTHKSVYKHAQVSIQAYTSQYTSMHKSVYKHTLHYTCTNASTLLRVCMHDNRFVFHITKTVTKPTMCTYGATVKTCC